MQPMPVVWASVFPEDADDFMELKLALGKLKLSDSSFSYEEESSGSLGTGFPLRISWECFIWKLLPKD